MTTTTTPSVTFTSRTLEFFLAVILILGTVWGVDSLIEKHDAKNDAKWSQLLATQKAEYDSDEAKLQTTLQQLTAQNVQLQQSIIQRNAALVATQKIDASLTTTQAATKLGGTAVDQTTVSLPIDTARSITAQLDSIPPLQANLASETQIANNVQTELTAQTKVSTDLQVELKDQTNACQAQIKAIKAKDRKRTLKVAVLSFIAGVITGIVK